MHAISLIENTKRENLGRKEYINDDLYEISNTDIYFTKCIKLRSKAKKIPERDLLFYRIFCQISSNVKYPIWNVTARYID